MIITIDGPAGSGKSTAARKLAARLEVAYLDTGAMYRAIALKAVREGVNLEDPPALVELAKKVDLHLDCGPTHTRVILDGHDVSEAVRSMEISNATPFIARVAAIREILVEKQQQIGRKLGSLVTEGRDQGSVVFPDADVKFFLDAALERRARRRCDEMTLEGEEVDYQEVLANLRARDGGDSHRWAPLLVPGAAIKIDTTEMSIHDVVERLLAHIRQLLEPPGSPTRKAGSKYPS